MKNIALAFTVIVLVFRSVVSAENFDVPPSLKQNVDFWTKVYTELSLSEGVLHDKDYPMIIYKRFTVETENPRERSRMVDVQKKIIADLLITMKNTPHESWSPQADSIEQLFKTYAPAGALDSADSRLRFQRGQKERFKLGLYRSGLYIDSIKAIFAQYGIPERLAYLPHVESSFDYEAYSKVGAAGIWQFMRSTGKHYLHIAYDVDERRDPIAETRAAAKLLSSNYALLKAWPIAITAWNYGDNGMKRAVDELGTTDIEEIIKRHESSTFKFSSKNFYGCFLAASHIAMNPEKYFPGITYGQAVSYRTIILDRAMLPTEVAKFAAVSLDTIKSLNLAFRPTVFKQNRRLPAGTAVHLPLSCDAVSVIAMKAPAQTVTVASAVPAPAPDTSTHYYHVKRGEVLPEIAKKLKVPLVSLVVDNDLYRVPSLFVGQELHIPDTSAKWPDSVYSFAMKFTTSTAPVQNEKPAVSPVNASGAVQTSTFDADIYGLESDYNDHDHSLHIKLSLDETIGHIAEWADVSQDKLRARNHLGRRSILRIGKDLYIPMPESTVKEFNDNRLEYHMGIEEDFYGSYRVASSHSYTAQRGENLWKLCDSIDIPFWLLKKINTRMNPDEIVPGAMLSIPDVIERTAGDTSDAILPLPTTTKAFAPVP